MQVFISQPVVEPLLLAIEAGLELIKVFPVDDTMRSVTFCTTVVTVQLAATNALLP